MAQYGYPKQTHKIKLPKSNVSLERWRFAISSVGWITLGWLDYSPDLNLMRTKKPWGGSEANHQEGKRILELAILRTVEELEDSEKRGFGKNVISFQIKRSHAVRGWTHFVEPRGPCGMTITGVEGCDLAWYVGTGVRRSGAEFCLCHLLAVWWWTNVLTSQYLSFVKGGIIILLYGTVRIKWVNTYKVLPQCLTQSKLWLFILLQEDVAWSPARKLNLSWSIFHQKKKMPSWRCHMRKASRYQIGCYPPPPALRHTYTEQ